MKIGILEAGLLREELTDRFDPYPVMFERFLRRAGRDLEFMAYSAVRGQMPASIFDCDGWLISGSRYGVYDRLEWMFPLQDFIRELAQARLPLIGVCFGHQIIAEALGGKVVKSDRGWGVGVQRYRIDKRQSWMRDQPPSIGLYAYHQDQIVTCPESATVFSSSEFCRFAGLSYGESIISVQAHPEFEEAYERALLELFGGSVIPAEVAQSAAAEMDAGAKADTQLLADWFTEFFLSHEPGSENQRLEQTR
ncbi:MAG: type 1 glutamine amidotransferase [Gammaproteobacteria bacterium]|nr:type 1 glutamine amidotransferase [Gammaproteobacteria bacterium]